MGRFADTAFGEAGLRRAWAEVLANDAGDGRLARGVQRFNDNLDDELGRLVADLAWGAYNAGDLSEVVLDTEDRRALQVPSVRDRIVARAILDAVTPVVDPVLGSASYAYRPGLGVIDAVQQLARLRDEGLGWVMRTDIDDCFPSIPVGLARRRFGALVSDPELLDVVDAFLSRMVVRPGRGRVTMRGLPQGCPLSPMLVNLILETVDAALLSEGFPLVRYADDLAVAVASEADGWEAVRCAHESVRRLGMTLGEEDTQVMSFEAGFTFLGEDFGPRYPVVLRDARVEEPERRVLYLGTQGGRVRKSAGRLLVETAEDVTALDVPTSQVSRLVCFGAVGVSAGVRSWAFSNDVDVVFASRRGSYLGTMLSGADSTRASRVRAQIAIDGTETQTHLCRAIVEAKIRKQIVVLQRFGRRDQRHEVREAISGMEQVLRLVPDATSTQEVMGLEGAAAAAYFPAFGSLMPDELAFTLRSRRPPMDVANSALSFLYTVLLGECVTAVRAAGLDPAFGVLHGDDDTRPSLALDLLEELRPMVVDQVVLAAARADRLREEHARTEEGRAGVLLTKAGREAVLDEYERRMLTRTAGALPGFAGTIRRHVYRQAQRLGAAVTRQDPAAWTGLSWR